MDIIFILLLLEIYIPFIIQTLQIFPVFKKKKICEKLG